jgi:hypothetical protein
MNLRSINITAKAGDDETMSYKHNLRHQTLEAHPRHDKSPDVEDDDVVVVDVDDGDGDYNGSNGTDGSDGNDGGIENCCNMGAMGCVIDDNDPRVHYGGPWVLEASDSSTIHSTVVEGSTVSFRFNGKFYQCPLPDPDTQLTLQVALSLSLAQSLQAISPSRRQLHISLIHCLPLSRHYPKQWLIFPTNRFMLLLICHRLKNTDSLSMSLKPRTRHRML